MASSTTFLLSSSASSSSTLPLSPSLNLLPFSLGSSSNPYISNVVPLSKYFQPGPSPGPPVSSQAGVPIATFRGRQLVGQTIEVPKGYKGVILGTRKRPDRGGVEQRGDAKKGVIPLTPISSTASVKSEEDQGGITSASSTARNTRATTTRGVGQVALSRPKMRQVKGKEARKRIRLDSDDEEDEFVKREEATTTSLQRTPSKRARVRGGATPTTEAVNGAGVPAIVIQAPTPRKSRRTTTTTTVTEPSDMIVEQAEEQEAVDESDPRLPGLGKEESMENIVPSPATEEDPPTFPTTPPASVHEEQPKTETTVEVVEVEGRGDTTDEEADGAIRIIEPLSSFSEIVLWTADAPLAGFRADELATRAVEEDAKDSHDHDKEKEGEAPKIEDQDPSDGSTVQKGWWRVGGAGEGGDEYVRGLGEWLGLVGMLNEPVYLAGLDDEDDGIEDD